MILKYQRHVNFTQSKWILEEQFYHETVNTDYIYGPVWSQSAKHHPDNIFFADITNDIPTRPV